MEKKILAVIPARGGSKRVPNKNVREIGGKPLIAHTIEQTKESEMLDRTIVSTEDDEIREVAKTHGGDVPFERPDELATDTATSDDVILHALDWFDQNNKKFDIVAMVQTTTPFRTSDDIDSALRQLIESDADSVISVSEFDVPPVWAVMEDENGHLRSYFEAGYLWTDEIPRSQDTPKLYHPNGAIFSAYVAEFIEQQSFYTNNTLNYKMPRSRSLDIDEPFDLELAQALMNIKS
jgi:CMP-N-acetylneuraminic acid synthetase